MNFKKHVTGRNVHDDKAEITGKSHFSEEKNHSVSLMGYNIHIMQDNTFDNSLLFTESIQNTTQIFPR